MKRFWIILVICLLVTVGCNDKKEEKNDNYSEKQWEEKTFFDSIDVPAGTINRLTLDYEKDGHEAYTVLVNDFSYQKFYEYIMTLENDGFVYEFRAEYVPKNINDLVDETETSWTANRDGIYIIANWRSEDNIYYEGYNLQLLFYNYDYTK